MHKVIVRKNILINGEHTPKNSIVELDDKMYDMLSQMRMITDFKDLNEQDLNEEESNEEQADSAVVKNVINREKSVAKKIKKR